MANFKHALVTGSEGFVGRHFVPFLKNQGYFVTGIDIKSTNVAGADIMLNGDCREFFVSDGGTGLSHEYDLVVHLAAIVGGRLTIEGFPLSVAIDLAIDSDMFNWAVRSGQPRVVYYSSSAAYPIQLQTKSPVVRTLKEGDINLQDIRTPDFSYGWTKLTGEMLAGYAEQQGVRVHVFRPFSGYGEDQDLDYPFPTFINRVKRREDPFTIWGTGEQVRDFVHIDDVVAATMEAVRLDIEGPVNLGSGIPVSFNQLADMMFEASGWHPNKVAHKTDMPEGVFYRCANNQKLSSFYTPSITLEEGICRALA